MPKNDYKAAYERQKKAREEAEKILEDKSRELFDSNQSLMQAYSRLKDQKAQLLHQEKLASIGQLAAGVAHEINNPTGFVKSNLRTLESYVMKFNDAIREYEALIRSHSNGSPETEEKIQTIRKAHDFDFMLDDVEDLVKESLEGTDRIENIVASLKNFARPDSDDDQEFSINECIENTLKLVNAEVKYKADIKLDLGNVSLVKGKPGAMSQVILNLIVNAADAIEEHGNISISTEMEAKQLKIKVSDNGPGIPQNMITRIFDPFFTTKDVGKGTGLGLAISHSIIKKHGGHIGVFSQPNLGTEFTIYLPTHNAALI